MNYVNNYHLLLCYCPRCCCYYLVVALWFYTCVCTCLCDQSEINHIYIKIHRSTRIAWLNLLHVKSTFMNETMKTIYMTRYICSLTCNKLSLSSAFGVDGIPDVSVLGIVFRHAAKMKCRLSKYGHHTDSVQGLLLILLSSIGDCSTKKTGLGHFYLCEQSLHNGQNVPLKVVVLHGSLQ